MNQSAQKLKLQNKSILHDLDQSELFLDRNPTFEDLLTYINKVQQEFVPEATLNNEETFNLSKPSQFLTELSG